MKSNELHSLRSPLLPWQQDLHWDFWLVMLLVVPHGWSTLEAYISVDTSLRNVKNLLLRNVTMPT